MRKAILRLALVVALAAPTAASATFIYELVGTFQPDVEPFDITHYHFIYTSPGGPIGHDAPLSVLAASLDLCVSTAPCIRIAFNDLVLAFFDSLLFVTAGISPNFVFSDGAFDAPGVYLSLGNGLNAGSGTLTVTEQATAAEPATVALLSLAVAGLALSRRSHATRVSRR